VAIKIPHDPEYAAALRQEGVLQDGLSGDHILEVLGLDPDHDPPYLVVQLVEGSSLRERIEQGPLEPAEAVRLLIEICRGLEIAHARGVVHRDLKPENVLLDESGRAFVSDFGLGLASEAVTAQLLTSGSLRTQSGKELAGTLRYMAPEQRDPDAEVDTRADLYALGVILFELLTGEAPCGSEVPSDVRPGLDPRFDGLFKRLCARLSSRAGSVEEVLTELEALRTSETPPNPIEAAAQRSVAVSAGLFWRFLAFGVDILPFMILSLGPLKMGRGVLAIGLYFLYDLVATTLTGRTVGKWIFGMRVATRDGKPADLTRLFLRQALRVLSLVFFGLGYLPLLLKQPAAHDLFADTRVLHDR
jgi:serine/threonine protein kinase